MTENGKALARQLTTLGGIVLGFVCLWIGIYVTLTSRCLPVKSARDRVNMIDVEGNLPFDPGAAYARCETDVTLSGDLPVLDGAAALYPLYAAIADALYPEDSVVWDAGAQDFAPGSAVQYRNTVRGFDALLDGRADVFFSAMPSRAQLEAAEAAGVALTMTPIGREAFVFLVNRDNPVDGLTQDQLRGLFTGEYTNWSQVGGKNAPVWPLRRVAGSGSQAALEAFLDGQTPVIDPLGLFGESIGYSFRWYVTQSPYADGVKLLAVDGVSPTPAAIRDGTYPLTTTFYAITRADDDDPNTAALLAWILSPEGQALIEANGYAGVAG